MRGKKRHTEAEIRSKMSESICGRFAAGENYNLTRDSISSEVVTGQVDVRNVKIPAYETENDITESEGVLDEEACDEGMEE